MKPSSCIHLQVVTKLKFFSLCAYSNAATISRSLSTSDVGVGAGAEDADADAPDCVLGVGVDAVGVVDVGDVDSNTKDVVALVQALPFRATLMIDSFFHNAASLGITVE